MALKVKGIHWMEWNIMTLHKSAGGLGFKNLHDFNLSMLGKQGWRLLKNPQSLASRVYKARYYPKDNFLTSSLGGNSSYIWRSIWEAKSVLKDGIRWCIGSGKDVSILNQPWLIDNHIPYIT